MGKYKTLRCFMNNLKAKKSPHILKDCNLVIEGDSYFRQQYKESGFNVILGGEYDRYAYYLKNILTHFINSNVTCYVVFTGAMKMDIEKRETTHQKIVDDRSNIDPGDNSYYDPVFTKDVHRAVLEEMGVRYCVTEYNARETLLDISRELNCPVLTHHFEQCLFGMSCVIPGTLDYDDTHNHIKCLIRTPESFDGHIKLFDEMKPIFWTILDENLPMYDKIPEIIGYKPKIHLFLQPLLFWIRKQHSKDSTIAKLHEMLATEAQKKIFQESLDEVTNMITHSKKSGALRYLIGDPGICSEEDQELFRNGIVTGKIPSVYINLKNYGTFSGSWVIYEQSRPDSMLPAVDIVRYAHSLLWDSPQNLTFIGRSGSTVYISDIPPRDPAPSRNFEDFIEETMPGFDWVLLRSVPEECWLLIITLVYYVSKHNKKFVTAADSILLSYVMLGRVSEKVGLLRKKNLKHELNCDDQEDSICTYKDCLEAAKAMIDYFDEGDIKETFERVIVHELAEFQHCLQHMNYLNKLCGKKIKCTNYYKTYNGTFVFNILLQLKGLADTKVFFENHLNNSPSVLNLFNNIKRLFDSLLSATR